MWENYKWDKTDHIQKLLLELEALKLLFDTLPQLPRVEEKLRRLSLLKSSVYSARIEGFDDSEINPKLESQNLLEVYNKIYAGVYSGELSLDLIKNFHKQVLKDIADGGYLRTEPWAIFDQFGNPIAMTPMASELPRLMREYIGFINTLGEPMPILAAIAQFVFEKIHPLPDGNGRVGRLISTLLLHNGRYSFKSQIPLEEYIEAHRENYYSALIPSKDATLFIEFFLTAIIEQGKSTLKKIQGGEIVSSDPKQTMSLRQEEIYEIIKDHPNCSFDFLKRRFLSVSSPTLYRDLAYLIKNNLIVRRGATSSAVYVSC
ncbi:Fic family protein [Candidatus Amesbacteria bacterium]|nr:Fic family protein [Candidatus Amesbacteria bacterium]